MGLIKLSGDNKSDGATLGNTAAVGAGTLGVTTHSLFGRALKDKTVLRKSIKNAMAKGYSRGDAVKGVRAFSRNNKILGGLAALTTVGGLGSMVSGNNK